VPPTRPDRAAGPSHRPAEVLAWLAKHGTQAEIRALDRYGIVAKRAYGVPMRTLLALRKQLGTDHTLATALWASGWYEARLLAALVGDPARVTRRQMSAWAASFENWGDCDTVCFHLFDRVPFAWEMVDQWAKSPREFVKRGAFALLASLALHDQAAPDARFLRALPLIERAARDERNFVKKGVSWALRAIGRRNVALNQAALEVARRLSKAADPASRWIGAGAARELASPKVRTALTKRRRAERSAVGVAPVER
jgi:3-methyladenine DNA glycosylase AlkD